MNELEQRAFNAGLFIGAGGVVLLLVIVFLLRPWLRAFFSGGPVPLLTIIGMRLRGNPPMLLVDAYLAVLKSGAKTRMEIVEAAYIANKNRVSTASDLVLILKQYKPDEPIRQPITGANAG